MTGATGSLSEFMLRLVLIPLAILIILLGLVVFSMPLPFGAVLIFIGCALLVSVSETASFYLQRLRLGYPRLNAIFASLERRAPAALSRALRRTAPKSAE